GSGNDTLVGGFGDDSLVGGSGADLFVFSNGGGNDILRDFNAGQGDLIGLAEGQTYTLATDVSGNARIVLGASDTVTLVGVQITAVSSSWFVTV
ncbi:calcium-binding protein, partial [Azospirillum argentinense]